ncbi:hypothetical protein [Streptomyces sp. NBC_01465]|uniref:hypothetical protein n=1 Tax=Streptomyces sp. NBC_01465 TaxID=2903878 RepID=UPI002E32F962|nr:hypothetical protein [Streptomyces sp. NBC_01465]
MTDSTGHNGERSVQVVLDYLVRHLNSALRRPGMYGGEMGIRLYLDAVAFADSAEEACQEELEGLRTRKAFFSTGVSGAFKDLWSDTHEGSMASVYAEIAHRQGWLALDRTLTAAEYAMLRHSGETWCREDRHLSDVVTAFGEPSVLFGGTNPRYPKTLAYATDRRDDALVCFHLWNGLSPSPTSPTACLRTEPVLWAIRAGGTLFTDGFTFTPEGAARLSPGPDPTEPEINRGNTARSE